MSENNVKTQQKIQPKIKEKLYQAITLIIFSGYISIHTAWIYLFIPVLYVLCSKILKFSVSFMYIYNVIELYRKKSDIMENLCTHFVKMLNIIVTMGYFSFNLVFTSSIVVIYCEKRKFIF